MNHFKAMMVFRIRERMEILGLDNRHLDYLKFCHDIEMIHHGPLTEANVTAYLRQCEGRGVEPVKDLSTTVTH